MLTRPLLLLLGASTMIACSSSTEPEGVALRVGEVGSAGAPADATSPPTVRITAGQVEVLGVLEAPTPCQDLRAESDRTAGRLTVTVTARARGELCAQVIASFAYSALVTNVPAGRYTVEVRHAIEPSDSPPVTEIETAVTVP